MDAEYFYVTARAKSLVVDVRDDNTNDRYKCTISDGEVKKIPYKFRDHVSHMIDSGLLILVDDMNEDVIERIFDSLPSDETKVITYKKEKIGVIRWFIFIIISLVLLPLFILVNMLSPLAIIAAVFNPYYRWNVFVAYDQFGNTLLGGDPDETISSRVGKAARNGSVFAKLFSWYLSTPDPDHCEKSVEKNEGKNGLF